MTGETGASPNSKKALAEGQTILWADESGFYLLPTLLRIWGPVARTSVIGPRLRYDHLSAISMTGELYVVAQEHFYHRSRAVREWLAQGAAPAHTVGAVALVCSGIEPGRRGMPFPGTCRVGQRDMR